MYLRGEGRKERRKEGRVTRKRVEGHIEVGSKSATEGGPER
jgi:hypothetical protein